MTNNLVRNQVSLRLGDYSKSLTILINQAEKFGFSVIVVENSNSLKLLKSKINVTHKRLLESKQLIFMPCNLDKLSLKQGISSGEHAMLKQVAQSKIIDNFDYIWKLTGRLSIGNLNKILINANGDMVVNHFFTAGHVVDSRFFGMSREVFKNFAINPPIYSSIIHPFNEINLHKCFQSMEHYLALFATLVENSNKTVSRLPQIPLYRGISGSTGKKLNTVKSIIATRISNFFRKIFIKGLIGIAP